MRHKFTDEQRKEIDALETREAKIFKCFDFLATEGLKPPSDGGYYDEEAGELVSLDDPFSKYRKD